MEITGIDGTTYSYRTADAQDVLFTPDVLPVKAEYKGEGTASVPKSELDFTDDKYAAMGLSSQTSIDAGDFLLFYSGTFGASALVRRPEQVRRLLPDAVVDAASIDDMMRFYEGRDAQ